MSELIYIIFLAASFGLLFILAKRWKLSRKIILGVWLLKILISIVYIYTYSTYYGEGDRIQGDALNFLTDSKELNNVAFSDPILYIKLLTGLEGDDEKVLSNELSETHIWDYGDNGDWLNDNRLIIRFNSVIHFFSFGNIYIHVLCFTFLAYIGFILILLSFKEFITNPYLFFVAINLFPSVAFWSCGLAKETITIFSMGLYFYALLKLLKGHFALSNLLYFLVSIFLLLINKPHIGLIIIPSSCVLIAGCRFQWKTWVLVVWTCLIIVLPITASYLPDNINLVEKISYKQKDTDNVGRGGIFFITDTSFCAFDYEHIAKFEIISDDHLVVKDAVKGRYKLFGKDEFKPFTIAPSDSQYEIYHILIPSRSYFRSTLINYKGINLLKTIPESLFNTLVRPFPWDKGSSIKIIAFVQNIFLLFLMIFAFIQRKKLRLKESFLIYALLTAALIILLLIGWTTPIFGAIVRYKVPAEILLLTSTFILLKPLTYRTK